MSCSIFQIIFPFHAQKIQKSIQSDQILIILFLFISTDQFTQLKHVHLHDELRFFQMKARTYIENNTEKACLQNSRVSKQTL